MLASTTIDGNICNFSGRFGSYRWSVSGNTLTLKVIHEGCLGRGQQRRYTDANAETMFSEPATGDTPDEQPGAMPEIFPSTPAPSSPRNVIDF